MMAFVLDFLGMKIRLVLFQLGGRRLKVIECFSDRRGKQVPIMFEKFNSEPIKHKTFTKSHRSAPCVSDVVKDVVIRVMVGIRNFLKLKPIGHDWDLSYPN